MAAPLRNSICPVILTAGQQGKLPILPTGVAEEAAKAAERQERVEQALQATDSNKTKAADLQPGDPLEMVKK
jgi:hypothetical protein